MEKVLKLLSVLLFGGATPWVAADGVLYIAGLWLIFKKCGVKSAYALIPGYREYAFAKCAGREAEGRYVFIGTILTTLSIAAQNLAKEGSPLHSVCTGVSLVVGVFVFFYQLRVWFGITDVFNRRRRWAWVWFFADGIAAMVWGLFKAFQPEYKVEDFEEETKQYFSGSRAAVLDNGLTVNLEKRTANSLFQKKTLLRDISLYIAPGHMVLLLGGSGAGKTTFVNAVNGYEPADAEIVLNGSNVYKDYKKMQYEIGFVPQQDLMRGSDTVLHTLLDAAKLRLPSDFNASERRERVDKVMEIFGLLPVKDSLVSKLSGGQRKRLSISMEFISNPTLFILDEPDSGLDGVMARELMTQLRAIADQGKIVLVITHTPDRVIDLFDDVIVLAKDAHRTGRLAFFGPVAEAEAFFGKDSMEQIVKSVNRREEGGEGRADEFIGKYAEVQHG